MYAGEVSGLFETRWLSVGSGWTGTLCRFIVLKAAHSPMTFLAVLCYLGSESRLASTKEKHATPLQEQFSSIAVLQIQTRVLNKDWEHSFSVTRSFMNDGSPVR